MAVMKTFALFAALASLVLFSGCSDNKSGGGNGGGGGAAKGNVFKYPIVTNPTSLDPAIVQDGDTIDMLQQVYEGLVAWGTNNEPVPNLAEKWDISPDGKQYTFHLKKGVKFFNGRELVADDFKFSIERACAKTFNSQTASDYLGDIVGVNDKLAGKANEVSGVKVVGKYDLQITIDKPRAYFLAKLTYPVSFAIAKESVPADKELNQIEQMMGTGPYKPKEFVPEQKMTLVANKDYHGGAPAIDGIERPVIKDPQTRLNKFKAGEVDLVQLEREDIKGVSDDPATKDALKLFDRPAIWYVGMNVQKYPAFADKRVRQAFAMAIDRERIVKDVLGNVNVLANCILPPGVLGHRDSAKFFPYDPAKAKALLAEAGYKDGVGLPPLEITFREQRPDIKTVSEAVSADLLKNLGVKTSLRSEEWRAYLDKHNKKEQIFFHMRWAADYLDPQNFLSLLLSTNGAENKTYYSNPKVDALCELADSNQNKDERVKQYAEAEDIVLDDCAWIPIYFQKDAELISPRVKGLRESLFGHLPHTTVTLK